MWHLRGQSLIELLIAVAVGTIMILGAVAVITPSLRGNTEVNQAQVGSALGRELLDNVRVLAESNWNAIYGLGKGPSNAYFLDAAQSPFVVATGTEGVASGDTLSGLAGYWKLDEATGTVIHDFSGNGYNGTSTGNPVSVTGEIGSALNFNGSGQYIDTGSNSVTGTSPFTLSAWIETADFGRYSGAVSIGASSLGQSAYIGVVAAAQAGVSNSIGGGFYGSNYGSGITTSNQWVQVVMTFSGGVGGTATIYVNGQSMIHQTYTPNLASTYRRIGRIGSDTAYDFHGSIDDVRIYNRALSAAEVSNLYRASMYTRYFYVTNVGRDGGGYILSSGGTDDPSTQLITVVYGAKGAATSTISEYITRSRNSVFDQTDWSGGPGQDGPVTSTNSRFASSSNIDYSTTTGSIRINGI